MVGLRWTCAVALVILVASTAWAQDALCSRCRLFVRDVGAGQWIGMSSSWRGLCPDCRDPERRCDQALEGLRASIQSALDELRRLHQEEAEALADGVPDPLWLQAVQQAQEELTADVARMRALLARLEQECAAQGVSDTVQGLNPGTSPGTGSNEPRDAPTGSGPVQGGVDVLEHLNPGGTGSDGSNVGRDAPTGSTGSGATLPADTVPEAAYLQGLRRYAASNSPLPRKDLVRLSEDGLPEPVLAEVPSSEEGLIRAEILAANAVAYAEAFDRVQAEARVAVQRGDRERALRLLEHGLWLAAAGQRELRESRRQRTQAARELLQLARLVTGRPAEVFASWQSQVREGALLDGLSGEQIREAQADVLEVGPREAARTHYRLEMDARAAERPPVDDAEWDLASVGLAHRIAGRGR